MEKPNKNTPSNYIEQLQSERLEAARDLGEREFRSYMANLLRQPHYYGILSQLRNGITATNDYMSVRDYLDLRALGVDPRQLSDEIKKSDGRYGEKLSLPDLVVDGDSAIEIYSYSSGISLKPESRKVGYAEPFDSSNFIQYVQDMYSETPFYNEVLQLYKSIGVGVSPHEITVSSIDRTDDPLVSYSILADLGLVGYRVDDIRELDKIMSESKTDELVRYLAHLREYSEEWSLDINQDEASFINDGPVKKIVTFSRKDKTFSVSIRRQVDYHYPERVRHVSDLSPALPFIETLAAYELTQLMEEQGLVFNERFHAEMIAAGKEAENRNGSVYSELSREVAKWVNRPSRLSVLRIFNELENSSQNGDREGRVREKISKIDLDHVSTPVGILVGLMKDCIAREKVKDDPKSDLEVEKSDGHVEVGACFDVAAYYMGSLEQKNGLVKVEPVGGVVLLHKKHGKETYLSTTPLLFNGVTIPKGSLLSEKDGKWLFMRLTPFSFDNPSDRLVLHAEYLAANKARKDKYRGLGDASLATLIRSAKKGKYTPSVTPTYDCRDGVTYI